LLLSKVCTSSRGSTKDWEKLKRIQVGNSCWSTWFPFSSIWTFLHCYLVMYVVRKCPWNSTFVDAQNSHRSICVCLGMWVMHCNNGSIHMLNLLLFEELGSSSPCLQRFTLWGQGSNIVHYDELSKALRNLKWSGLFLEPFKGCELSKNKVQWLDFASWLWLLSKCLPYTKIVYAHFVIIM